MKLCVCLIFMLILGPFFAYPVDVSLLENHLSANLLNPKTVTALPDLGLLYYYSDQVNYQVNLIRADGSEEFSFGKQGQAPDEFSGFPSIFSDGNNIFCHDLMGAKVNVYDPRQCQLIDILSTRNFRNPGFLIRGRFNSSWVGLKFCYDRESQKRYLKIGSAANDLSHTDYLRELKNLHPDKRINNFLVDLTFLKGMITLTHKHKEYIILNVPGVTFTDPSIKSNATPEENRIIVIDYSTHTEKVYILNLPDYIKDPSIYSHFIGMDGKYYVAYEDRFPEKDVVVNTALYVLDMDKETINRIDYSQKSSSIYGVLDNHVLTMGENRKNILIAKCVPWQNLINP